MFNLCLLLFIQVFCDLTDISVIIRQNFELYFKSISRLNFLLFLDKKCEFAAD